MKSILALFLVCWAAPLFAQSLVVVKGGASPDRRLAVAVVPQKEGAFIDEADTRVLLIDYKTKKIIGPLEEVDSGGGSWGKTTDNVVAVWSPNGRFLAINFRIGRLMHAFVVYEITGRRARLQKLPEPKSHPKGKVYEQLGYAANPGEAFTAWLSSTEFTTEEYGLRPRDMDKGVDGSKFGLADFDGSLEKLFTLQKDRWVIKDIRLPKARPQ